MKKFIAAAMAAAVIAAPAYAATLTISFANDDGTTSVWSFDQETSKASNGEGIETDYTWDEDTLTLCAAVPDAGDLCATFESQGTAVGDTSKYTLSTGGGGTATITGIEE